MRLVLTIIILTLTNQVYSQTEFGNIPTLDNNLTDSIGLTTNFESTPINSQQWNNAGFNKLEYYDSEFDYAIIGQFAVNDLTLILVNRTFTEEQIHWLCIVNKDYQLIDELMTAYDNSEGFLAIKSIITNDQITVTEWNYFSDTKQKTTRFRVTKTGFSKIKPAHNNG